MHAVMKPKVKRRKTPLSAIHYAERVRRSLGGHIKEIRLFGSQARGDASVASDYDFLIVLDRKDKAFREKITDVGVQMMNESDQIFAALVYGEEEWSAVQASPLGWNISAEGIAL
jgi:uncharacterized protein